MARENKRKRDERRFGKPERLADRLTTSEWLPGPWSLPVNGELVSRDELRGFFNAKHLFIREVLNSTIVVADNVYEYVRATKEMWDPLVDFPNPVPPMSPLFIEFDVRNSSGRVWRCGWLYWAIRRVEFGRLGILNLPSGSVYQDIIDRLYSCSDSHIFVHSWLIMEDNGVIRGPLFRHGFLLDPFGAMAGDPVESLSGYVNPVHSQDALKEYRVSFQSAIVPSVLTLSFMNCKNIVATAVCPDARINRERRKAGLKPFLRYHTINIEPMKHVLRTEGGIEENGLKKALHICRGHFATYSDSFLGRKLEKPMTVWRPSHVRGSFKQGVVISDYKVNPPITEGQ